MVAQRVLLLLVILKRFDELLSKSDALGNTTTYTYGGTGCSSCGGGVDKLTAITDSNGNATKYEHDTLGRLTKETDPLAAFRGHHT